MAITQAQTNKIAYFLQHPTFITILVLVFLVFFISDIALIYYYGFVAG